MRKTNATVLLPAIVLIAVVLACKFSATTANISSLKVGKDRTVTSEASTFEGHDRIYAVSTISNSISKVKVKGLVAFEDVAGQAAGPVPGAEATVDLPGSGEARFSFTPPPSGWPPGKYKIEVTLIDDTGAQKDQKTASFSVS